MLSFRRVDCRFVWSQLEAACTEYHKMARMLQLIPVTAEHACGVDYELKATTNKTESDKFVNIIRVCTMSSGD